MRACVCVRACVRVCVRDRDGQTGHLVNQTLPAPMYCTASLYCGTRDEILYCIILYCIILYPVIWPVYCTAFLYCGTRVKYQIIYIILYCIILYNIISYHIISYHMM
jgi:hypothetical protein